MLYAREKEIDRGKSKEKRENRLRSPIVSMLVYFPPKMFPMLHGLLYRNIKNWVLHIHNLPTYPKGTLAYPDIFGFK